MMNQEENRNNNLGRALLLVFFFLFIVVFSGKSDSGKIHIQACESISVVEATHTQAIISDVALWPDLQATWVSSCDPMNFRLFNKSLKLSADNFIISQQLNILHQNESIINPLTICRFYYHFFSADSDGLPIRA